MSIELKLLPWSAECHACHGRWILSVWSTRIAGFITVKSQESFKNGLCIYLFMGKLCFWPSRNQGNDIVKHFLHLFCSFIILQQKFLDLFWRNVKFTVLSVPPNWGKKTNQLSVLVKNAPDFRRLFPNFATSEAGLH